MLLAIDIGNSNVVCGLSDNNHWTEQFRIHTVANKTADALPDIVAAVGRCGSLEYTREAACRYRDAAADNLSALPNGKARDAMESLLDLAVNRDRRGPPCWS